MRLQGLKPAYRSHQVVPLRVSKHSLKLKDPTKNTRNTQQSKMDTKNEALKKVNSLKCCYCLSYLCRSSWKYIKSVKVKLYPPESHRKQIFTSGDLVNQDDQWKSHEVLSMFPGCYLCFKRAYLLKHLVPLAN